MSQPERKKMKDEKEIKGLGGRQTVANHERGKITITHFNIALEMLAEQEEDLMAKAREFFRASGITFKEVGGGATRFNGKRCPHCNELIHAMANECGHCGMREIK